MTYSFEEWLRAVQQPCDDDFASMSMSRRISPIAEDSKTWTDDQRVLFMTKSERFMPLGHLYLGNSPRVCRMALAVGYTSDGAAEIFGEDSPLTHLIVNIFEHVMNALLISEHLEDRERDCSPAIDISDKWFDL